MTQTAFGVPRSLAPTRFVSRNCFGYSELLGVHRHAPFGFVGGNISCMFVVVQAQTNLLRMILKDKDPSKKFVLFDHDRYQDCSN